MAHADGASTRGVLPVAQRAFTAGCFGCFGVASGAFVVFLAAFVVFQPPFVALFRSVSLPIVISIQPAPNVSVPSGQATAMDVFVTSENRPGGPRVTEVKVPVQQPLFVCVCSAPGHSVRFRVRIVLPSGDVVPFGEFDTDPNGNPVCLGALSQLPNVPGVVRIEVVIGTSVVGSTTVVVTA